MFCLIFQLSAQTDSTARHEKYFWGQLGLNYSLSNNYSDVWGVNGGLGSNFAEKNFLFLTASYQVRLRKSDGFLSYDRTPNCVTSRKNISICFGRGIKILYKSYLILQTGLLLGEESYRGNLLGIRGGSWFSLDKPIFDNSNVSYIGIPVKLSYHSAIFRGFGVTINLYYNIFSPHGDYGISINTCFGKIRKKLPRNNTPFR